MARSASRWVMLLATAVVLSGCGGGGGGSPPTGAPTGSSNPLPAIASLSPSSATAGAAAQTLTIAGSNFLATSSVTYNGVAHNASFLSANQLTIPLTAADQATAGSYPVVVSNPGPGGGASGSVAFTVNNPAPMISSLSPSAAMAGGAAQTLTINGANFVNTSTVTYNGVAHPATFVGANQLTIPLSAADQAAAGSFAVVAASPEPGGGNSDSVSLEVVSQATAIDNVQFSGSAGDYTLTISGNGFGSLAQPLPFTGTSGYLRIGDPAQSPSGEYGYTGDANQLTYQSWSGNQIVVSGFGGSAGDSAALVLWNPSTGAGAAWGGTVPPPATASPVIGSVQFTGTGQNLAMTIQGVGFGAAPSGVPFTGDSNFLAFTDWASHCTGNAQFTAGNGADPVTLVYQSWSDTQIQLAGFGGAYGQGCASVQPGDPVSITLWNSAASGVTSPQTAWGGFLPGAPASSVSSVAVSPATASVAADQSQPFTATVAGTGSLSQAVTWAVNSVSGGNGTVGTITAAGVYTAPDPLPSPAAVTVTAASQQSPAVTGSAAVTLVYAQPAVAAVAPSSLALGSGPTTITISGAGFSQVSSASLSDTALATTFVSPSQLTAVVPASSTAALGTLHLTVSNPSPGGGSSAAASLPVVGGMLTVTIAGLPTGAAAAVALSGPNGYAATLTSSQTLQLAPGTYTVTAAGVAVGSVTYYAIVPTQMATVAVATPATVAVNYGDVVPQSTKVLDSAGMAGLTVSPNGQTLTLPASSPVAANLAVGDIIASAPTPAAPNGLLDQVMAVSTADGVVTVSVTPATLAQAIQTGSASFSQSLTSTSVASVKTVRSGVSLVHARPAAGAGRHSLPNLTDSCSDDNTSFIAAIADITLASDGSGGSIDANGSVEVCPVLNFSFTIGGLLPSLTSLTASIQLGDHAELSLGGGYTGNLDTGDQTLLVITTDPITIFVGAVPVVVTPTVTLYVGASGELEGSFSTGVTQDASATAGIQFSRSSNPQWSTTFNSSNTFAQDPLALDASLDLTAYAGADVALEFYGVVTPSFSPEAFLELSADTTANPWWTLTAGLQGSAGIDVSVLDDTLVNYDTGPLFTYSDEIANAGGPFSPAQGAPVLQAVSPNTALVGAVSAPITATGANFAPGAVLDWNGTPLPTTFLNGDELAATIPASDLAASGTFSITAVNPDDTGTPSAPNNFAVNNPAPAITALQPSTVAVGAGAQVLAIHGSGFLPNSGVTLNGSGTPATYTSGTELSVNLSAAALAQAGTIAVVVTNASPGGGASNPASLPVTNGTAVSVNPGEASVLAGGTQSFAATVTGNSNPAVNWSVQEGATGGAITAAGLYTAPATPGTFHVVAASQATPAATGIATVIVGSGVIIAPATATIPISGSETFTATLSSDQSGGVTWSVLEGSAGGAITSAGVYTAPASAGTYHVVATTQSGATAFATVVVVASEYTVLHAFTGGDGSLPNMLIQGSDGNFYGTTFYGGASGAGTVFRLDATGDITTLYSFTGGDDGDNPNSIMQASSGNFYGTACNGGTSGDGTIFEISSGGQETTLASFDNTTGQCPNWQLQPGPNGVLYGVTLGTQFHFNGANVINPPHGQPQGGGHPAPAGQPASQGYGTVFQINLSNDAITVLYAFTDGADGDAPEALIYNSGMLYGTTLGAGATGNGTIFTLNPTTGVLVTSQTFANVTSEGNYYSDLLVSIAAGGFAGTTFGGPSGYGLIYGLNSTETSLSALAYLAGSNGDAPTALLQAADGSIYGGAFQGGANGDGAIFRIANGTYSDLYDLNNANGDGQGPAWIIQGSDGNFYGITADGGANSDGAFFQLANPSGSSDAQPGFEPAPRAPTSAAGAAKTGAAKSSAVAAAPPGTGGGGH